MKGEKKGKKASTTVFALWQAEQRREGEMKMSDGTETVKIFEDGCKLSNVAVMDIRDVHRDLCVVPFCLNNEQLL